MEPHNSILLSTKKTLGLEESDTSFDLDVMLHINSVLADLSQIGVGPVDGFEIEDEQATWDQLLGADKNLNRAKSYVYLKVRMLFDPPTTSYLQAAMKEQIQEIETRMSYHREDQYWTSPLPPQPVIDGGGV